ncbi:MAG: class I SAM-dependent methyltransferase [Lysobacterales bacterium]
MGLSSTGHPKAESPGQELQQEYRLRFGQLAQYRQSVWAVLCHQFFSRYVAQDHHVLDLGCGWGEFVNNVDAAQKWAMDLNPDAAERLASDIHFVHQDCSDTWPLGDASLDTVFSSNFLEHLPDKPAIERTLDQIFRCLKPGGQLILLGPNMRYVPGEYWDFWDHHVPLTDRSVAEVLAMRGFVVEEQVDRFLPFSMSTGRTPPLLFLKVYLKLRPAWRLFGKQFLVVARRPIG